LEIPVLRYTTRLSAALALLLTATLLGLGGSFAADVPATPAWSVQKVALGERVYFANLPSCQPVEAAACVSFMSRPRQVVTWLHAARAFEDDAAVVRFLTNARGASDHIWVYPISKGGTRVWDAGICCTSESIDETGYLVSVVEDIDRSFAVNRNRVGVIGQSNGGMLAEKIACERPEVFRAAASWAGPWGGNCPAAGVQIGHWHGGADDVVPIGGGTRVILGRSVNFPPAYRLGTTMSAGSTFVLHVKPTLGHVSNTSIGMEQYNWLNSTLPK
jgi:pimeloyl-ACP methyl ester carboxylesterase